MLSQETIIHERQKIIEALLSILDGLEKQDYGRVIEGIKNIALLLAGAGAGKMADLILDKDPKFSSFTDPRDGKTYRTVKLIGNTWMAENLDYDIGEGSWYYDNNPMNGVKYGRLYTWEAAKRACPSGWRLPSDEEWNDMAISFGGYYDSVNGEHKPTRDRHIGSYKTLLRDGDSGFAALLGGSRNHTTGKYYSLGVVGFYWSGTEKNEQDAFLYYFDPDYKVLFRHCTGKAFGFSCRCLQGAPSNGID